MTIYGSDVSHYDGADTRAMFGQGIAFQTHKAGGDANDGEIGSWWSYVKDYRATVLLGAYWVLYPGNPVGRADAFIARLDATCPGWRDGPFVLQADCEIWNGDPSTKPGLADIRAFCNQLRSRLPRLMPIVYASAGQYGDSLTGLGYPLWNARYPLDDTPGSHTWLYAQCGGDAGKGWGKYSGQVPAIWQYSSSATVGGQSTCDVNAFRGTLGQLRQLLAPGWTEGFDDVSVEDVVTGNTQYDAVTGAAGAHRNATGVAVWDNQDIPNAKRNARTPAYTLLNDLYTDVLLIKQTVADLAGKDFTDEAAIAQMVLAGLGPATMTDAMVAALQALPAETAKQVLDEMSTRLASGQ